MMLYLSYSDLHQWLYSLLTTAHKSQKRDVNSHWFILTTWSELTGSMNDLTFKIFPFPRYQCWPRLT